MIVGVTRKPGELPRLIDDYPDAALFVPESSHLGAARLPAGEGRRARRPANDEYCGARPRAECCNRAVRPPLEARACSDHAGERAAPSDHLAPD